ncbi:hypothetical protein HMPREF3192_00987 [Atopobium deltae]|uniref:Uncharacterized protein n=1 Tax=Atopobium deltae TaxID=1393034 RepID=A0A133XS47_9ACTN|nr:hypothetical protein HMPREF3192_00987 [Atopobium deltae]
MGGWSNGRPDLHRSLLQQGVLLLYDNPLRCIILPLFKNSVNHLSFFVGQMCSECLWPILIMKISTVVFALVKLSFCDIIAKRVIKHCPCIGIVNRTIFPDYKRCRKATIRAIPGNRKNKGMFALFPMSKLLKIVAFLVGKLYCVFKCHFCVPSVHTDFVILLLIRRLSVLIISTVLRTVPLRRVFGLYSFPICGSKYRTLPLTFSATMT